jgi:dihydroorotase
LADTFDTIFKGGTVVNHDGAGARDVGIKNGRLAAIGSLEPSTAGNVVDVTGLHVLPGVIDTQVHFREPGGEGKEDLKSGSLAAVMGGVTAVFEMPNTNPPTTNAGAIEDKLRRAKNRMHCDHAFYVGGTEENAEELPDLEMHPGICGVKVFMGSSTGTLLVPGDEGVSKILNRIRRRAAFHSEDEFILRERRKLAEEGKVETHQVWRSVEAAVSSTKRLLAIAKDAGALIHVLHVSTQDELPLLAAAKDFATCEITPQHLTLAAPECYEEWGTYAQMNPPIRGAEHREGLWKFGIASGVADVIGSDHAPHTKDEKEGTYPNTPSGMPGVQTLLPLMLDHMNAGRLSLDRVVDLTSHGANRVFGIAGKGRLAVGYDADLTIVDLKAKRTIGEEWIASRAGWSPFVGKEITGWPKGTIIRGRTVMWEDELVTESIGEPMQFHSSLRGGR